MSDAGAATVLSGWNATDAADYIERVQRDDGQIPWYADGLADPWDHVESAMGLSVAGRHGAARAAYRWLADVQLADGSWWATYGEAETGDADHGHGHGDDAPRKEPHRTAYVAVGAWHHYRTTGDRAFLAELWPTVRRALDFALAHRGDAGEVYWAVGVDGEAYEDALVTGCCSVYKSLACGAAIADCLDDPDTARRYREAQARLGRTIRDRPDRFDRTWESKGRYAMDWFYPVLCGVVTGAEARERLAAGADRFVEPGLGCRCVADEPWVTVAESCELALSLAACGRRERGARVFGWLERFRDRSGAYWTGYQFEDDELWPAERPTWTAGAALLAADALCGLSPAADFFTDRRRA